MSSSFRPSLALLLVSIWGITTGIVVVSHLFNLVKIEDRLLQLSIEERAHFLARELLSTQLASYLADTKQLSSLLRLKADHLGIELGVFSPEGHLLSATNPAISKSPQAPEEVQLCRQLQRPLVRKTCTLAGRIRWSAAFPLGEPSPRAVLWLGQETSLDMQNISRPLMELFLASAAFGGLLGGSVCLILGKRLGATLSALVPDQFFELDHAAIEVHFPRWYPREIVLLFKSWQKYFSQMRLIERHHQEMQKEYEAILENVADGIVILDAQGRGEKWNKRAAQLLRFPVSLSPGRLLLPERVRQPAFGEWLSRVLSGEGVSPLRITLDAPERHLEFHAASIAGDREAGDTKHVVIIRDVTRAEVLDRIRRDFVANVSHELKTPLTTMKGFLETLLDGAIEEPEKGRRFTQIVLEQTDRLERLVDDLLVLTRLDSESDQPLDREQIATSELVAGAIEQCRLTAERRGMPLRAEILAEESVRVNVRLFQMALVNLIDNAIKYSDPAKTIIVRVEKQEGEVRFSVIDQGWGIEARHLPRIFERFYRVDPGRSRELGGTGLGLSIVKHAAQVHGGYVSVESQVGVGSTFTIHLPT